MQSGLNSLMNTIKFVLVILLPEIETFGWLVILSFAFVSFGAICFSVHAINKTKIERKSQNVFGQSNDPEI
jgi:hypothetical protein